MSAAPIPIPGLLATAITICLIGTVGIGLYPGPWVSMVVRIAATVFATDIASQ